MPREFSLYHLWVRRNRNAKVLPAQINEQANICAKHIDYLAANFHRGIKRFEIEKILPEFLKLEAMLTRSE